MPIKKMSFVGKAKPVKNNRLHEFGNVIQGDKPGAFGNSFENAWDWKRNTEMYRNKPKARTVTENSTFEDYMKIQQVDNNGRTNIGQKESEDAWRSVLAAGTDQEPEYVSGPRPIGTLTAEATDDRGRTIPGSDADDNNSKTIGKFRSQPGAGPGQAERNAAAKKKAEAEAKTANEARGIGGKWDTPSQKYSANRMRDFTPPTPEQVKKERERRLKAGLNADGSKKTKTEGMKRLTRVGNAKIKKRGGILNVGSDDKEMNTQFKKERENQVGGDARNTGTKVRATLGTPEGKHRMARKRDQHESTEHQISQLDTSTPVGAARAKELKIRQKARHLDAKDAEAGKRQGYKVDSQGRPLKGQRVKPATPAAARAAQNKEDL